MPYGSFPVFDKVTVFGPGSLEAFVVLQGGGGPGKEIGWNYAKFLVDSEGKLVKRYDPQDDPMDAEEDIKELLAIE